MADKRTPRRGAPGGGFGGGGGGGRPGGRPPGGGRSQGGWRPPPGGRPDRDARPDRPARPPARGGPRDAPPPWASDESAGAPESRRGRPPRATGRWEAVQADSLDELATALNELGVQPERLVHLAIQVHEGEDDDTEITEGYEALVWVD